MLEIPIVYEDDNVLIVNKPSGIAMHDSAELKSEAVDSPAKSDTHIPFGIVSLLKKQLNVAQLHLCHRLDTGTSGCLCLAKDEITAAQIGELFATRRVGKYYLALSAQKPKKKQGAVIGDMKNRRGGQRILLKSTENPAITQFFSQSAQPGVRGFIVKPYSGKTHQIRVALKSIGAPILGDTLYAGAPSDRLHLHAWHIVLPMQQKTITAFATVDSGQHFLSHDVQQWITSLNAPETYPWPAVPQRYLASSIPLNEKHLSANPIS